MSKTSHSRHEKSQKHQAKSTPHVSDRENMIRENSFGADILIAILIFALGIFFMIPAYSALTVHGQAILLGVFILAILIFVITHWRRHRGRDHKDLPPVERLVYLASVSLLAIAIVVQALNKTLDIWLVFILVMIVLLKMLLVSRYWGKK